MCDCVACDCVVCDCIAFDTVCDGDSNACSGDTGRIVGDGNDDGIKDGEYLLVDCCGEIFAVDCVVTVCVSESESAIGVLYLLFIFLRRLYLCLRKLLII